MGPTNKKDLTPSSPLEDSSQESYLESKESTYFILRGFITFYGLHYIAYFYSAKYDNWFQFNDESIKQIGNFEDVRKRCLAGKQRPTTLFYERSDVIMNVLSTGAFEEETEARGRAYFKEDEIKHNNFWNGKSGGGGLSGCSMF